MFCYRILCLTVYPNFFVLFFNSQDDSTWTIVFPCLYLLYNRFVQATKSSRSFSSPKLDRPLGPGGQEHEGLLGALEAHGWHGQVGGEFCFGRTESYQLLVLGKFAPQQKHENDRNTPLRRRDRTANLQIWSFMVCEQSKRKHLQ